MGRGEKIEVHAFVCVSVSECVYVRDSVYEHTVPPVLCRVSHSNVTVLKSRKSRSG